MSRNSQHAVTRKICRKCQKQIYIGNRNVVCNKCNSIFHKICAKNHTQMYRNQLYCKTCIEIHEILRYNPFFDTLKEISENHDSIFLAENEPHDSFEILEPMSTILENCKQYTIDEFCKFGSQADSKPENSFSCHFLNIDGNASSFDTFAITLNKITPKFSVIGIAETNIEEENKNLYMLNDYSSIYQSKFENKKKGSGIGIYVRDDLIFTKLDRLSLVNENTESLFIEISHEKQNIYIGIISIPLH